VRSSHTPAQFRISKEVRDLIYRMVVENPGFLSALTVFAPTVFLPMAFVFTAALL
jgi:hypothetical protein